MTLNKKGSLGDYNALIVVLVILVVVGSLPMLFNDFITLESFQNDSFGYYLYNSSIDNSSLINESYYMLTNNVTDVTFIGFMIRTVNPVTYMPPSWKHTLSVYLSAWTLLPLWLVIPLSFIFFILILYFIIKLIPTEG
jgi:hypothetical protein